MHSGRLELCRWDNSCCEDDEWQKASDVASLPHGLQQPFYQVLVDSKDWEGQWARPAVAYVAQELLEAPEVHALHAAIAGCSAFCPKIELSHADVLLTALAAVLQVNASLLQADRLC